MSEVYHPEVYIAYRTVGDEVLGVIALTYNRARIVIGKLPGTGYSDGW